MVDYATGNNSGVLFGSIVAGGTGTADGGSYIDLANGTQFKQNFDSKGTSVKHYGAVGDGVTNDTATIQATIDARKVVYFPYGQYLTVPNGLSHTSNNWYLTIRVPADRKLFGEGELLSAAVYANRTQILSLLGGNVYVEGLTFTNTNNDATQPYSIGVGFATNRDDSIVVADYEHVRVRNCKFNRNFLQTSFFFSTDFSAATLKDLVVESCSGTGHPFSATSAGTGMFDYHYVTNACFFNNVSVGGTFASSYNMVGVQKGVISGNYAQDNGYAGSQLENGTEKITVTGNTFVNCRRGVWVDDSAKITISGNNLDMQSQNLIDRNIFVKK